MRWGLRFLLGEQQLGNSSVKVCGENHCEVILSMVRICLIHFPGHAWIFAVLWLAQEKLLSEQIQQNNLVAVRSVLSLDCISGHLLLTSLGIFTPLGSEEGLCMKYLLKKNNTSVKSMIWPWNFSWKFPKHRKTSKPKISLLSPSCLLKVYHLAVSLLPVTAATV